MTSFEPVALMSEGMSRQALSPSPDTALVSAFASTWLKVFPPAMVRGTATEPIALDDDTPSPRRSPEPSIPPNPTSTSHSQPIIISDSDDDDDNGDVPSAAARPAPLPRLASRGSTHPWMSSSSRPERETPPQTKPVEFERTRSRLSSPSTSVNKTPKPSPNIVTNAWQAINAPQQQAMRNSRTPSGQVPAPRARTTGSPLAMYEDFPQRRTNRRFSPPIHENSPKMSPWGGASSRLRSPSQKVQPPRSGMDISPKVPRAVSASLAVPVPKSDAPVDGDVAMQDEVISEAQVIQQDPVIQQEEATREGEVMQDVVIQWGRGTGTREQMLNDEAAVESTIGTESPLLERIRQRRLRAVASDAQADDDSVDNMTLEYRLRQFEVNMEEYHATDVRWLLHDARRASTSISRFTDDESPFASAESVLWVPGTPIPAGHTKVRLESHSSKKGKARLHLVTNNIESEISRVPRYHAHTLVKRNILTADDDTLRYMPYLGEDHSTQGKRILKRTKEDLETAFAGKVPKDSRELERQILIRGYLDTWLEELKLGISVDGLTQYILAEDNWDIDIKLRDIQTLKKDDDYSNTWDMCKRFAEAFHEVFRYRLKDVILGERRVKELIELAKSMREEAKKAQASMPKDTMAERLSTFTDWTCLICGALYCQTHGDWHDEIIEHSDDSESDVDQPQRPRYLPIHRQLVMGYNDILRKHATRNANSQLEEEAALQFTQPCSNQCYCVIDPKTQDKYELSQESRIGIESMLISLPSPKKRSCTIAFSLNLPCWPVDVYIGGLEPRKGSPPNLTKTKKPDWYDNKKKTLKDHWQDHTDAHLHQRRVQAQACAHDGPCDNKCPCFKLNILCESFCGCPDDCARKWTGCGCRSSGINCQSDVCICVQMNRECGPLCGSCGAIPRIRVANKHNDDLFATGCQNIPLQRGVSKKLIIGESQLVGFGLYLAEPARKGAYLSEYTGEAISLNESERRGVIYDRKYLSFLFDLNSEWVIDAARFGNKTRFINHAESEKNGLNCAAQIVLVNGEHRIKFYALRDIQVGEELLFNYGKKFAEKQGLNAKLPTANGKKGLVVGDEAIDALDGLDPSIRRGRNTAIRGGRGRKARKIAGPERLESRTARKSKLSSSRRIETEEMDVDMDMDADVDVDVDITEEPLPRINDGDDSDDVFEDIGGQGVDEEEDDEEAEDDSVDLGEGRLKRMIRRPARYTR